MIRIIAIVGSPRIGGNTELLAAETLKAAEEEGAKKTVRDFYKERRQQWLKEPSLFPFVKY